MTPLRVQATLHGPISMPNGPLALDALLMWAEAQRRELPPPALASECQDLPIPIQRSECGRYYLASFGQCEREEHEVDWTNRRFPIPEAQMLGGPKVRRIQITGGPSKSYRLPRDRSHVVDDAITWWCVGDAVEIRELLSLVGYLGKRRAVGLGRVREWRVEPCESWLGFPVLRDGLPLRALPLDVPGIADEAERAYATLSPPYWDWSRQVEAAVPRWE